jgi:putative endonuclease
MSFAGLGVRLRNWAARLGFVTRMPEGTRSLGAQGEIRAQTLLTAKGYRILAKNVRLGFAEADLVCEAPDRRTIVIVEVKTRRVHSAGSLRGRGAPPPEASVGAKKKRKLVAAARYLVKANGWHERPVRVDAVAVEWRDASEPTLRHLIGVADGNR